MQGKLFLLGLFLALTLFCASFAQADESIGNSYAPLDINQWMFWLSNQTTGSVNPYDTRFSAYFPQGAAGVVYTDAVLWGGIVHDGHSPALRVGGSCFRSGVRPGWIIQEGTPNEWPKAVSPDDPRVRIFRIRRDIFDFDEDSLRQDASVTFHVPLDSVTPELLDSLRQRYIKDWNEWPADLGAPYYDRNRNGQYDPDFDEPGILGADQLIWYVVNDADPTKSRIFLGSPPMGIELQVTAWVYRWGLSQTVFRRYRLINKSGALIDSMFFSQFAEPDLGDYSDNLAGCDSAAGFGFVYNGQAHDNLFDLYSMPPPSVAYVLLQGPAIPDDTASDIINFKTVDHIRNLPMTSFWLHQTGGAIPDPVLGDYESGSMDSYAIMNGYAMYWNGSLLPQHKVSFDRPIITKFPANGNPLTGQGDIDGQGNSLSPGVRAFYINSGPFSMEPDTYQDIIVATVGALPNAIGDNFTSLRHLFDMMGTIEKAYQEFLKFEEPFGPRKKEEEKRNDNYTSAILFKPCFPNPFSQNTNIKFKLTDPLSLRVSIYNSVGQEIKVIYQGHLEQGEYAYLWDGTNSNGKTVPSGLYFISLRANGMVRFHKLLFLK